MDRKDFDQTLGQAIISAIVFVLVEVAIIALPKDKIIWDVLKFVLLMFLFLINAIMLIGFTSFQNYSTKFFYSLIIPIYPLYLISDEVVWRWEWWHYFVLFISYSLFIYFLILCFSSRFFTRTIETIVLIISIFSTPFLYSAVYIHGWG